MNPRWCTRVRLRDDESDGLPHPLSGSGGARAAALSALARCVPAVLISILLFRIVGEAALLPLHMTMELALLSLLLTLAVCLISAVMAVRRVVSADPAEVF